MYVYGKVADTKGNPVPGAIIETWETDGHGLYDNQVSVHKTRPSHNSSSGQVPKSRGFQNVEAALRVDQTEPTLIEP